MNIPIHLDVKAKAGVTGQIYLFYSFLPDLFVAEMLLPSGEDQRIQLCPCKFISLPQIFTVKVF